MISARKLAVTLPVSAEEWDFAQSLRTTYRHMIDDQLGRPVDPFDLGLHGPWPYQRCMEAPLLWTVLRRAVADDPLALAVLDLHGFDRTDVSEWHVECLGCDFGGYEGEPPEWPCRTVRLLVTRYLVAA